MVRLIFTNKMGPLSVNLSSQLEWGQVNFQEQRAGPLSVNLSPSILN